jgi:hypothetical protein
VYNIKRKHEETNTHNLLPFPVFSQPKNRFNCVPKLFLVTPILYFSLVPPGCVFLKASTMDECVLKRLSTVISTAWFQSLLMRLCCFHPKVLHTLNRKLSVSLKGSCLCHCWSKKEKGVSRYNAMKETNRNIVIRAFCCILSLLCGSSIFLCFGLRSFLPSIFPCPRSFPSFDLSLPSASSPQFENTEALCLHLA